MGASSHALCERVLVWHEQARRAGRKCRTDMLLLLAWLAYDRRLRRSGG
jgi:hypothetical protein